MVDEHEIFRISEDKKCASQARKSYCRGEIALSNEIILYQKDLLNIGDLIGKNGKIRITFLYKQAALDVKIPRARKMSDECFNLVSQIRRIVERKDKKY